MRIVADTNVVVSGFLWFGNERLLLDAARDGIVELFVTRGGDLIIDVGAADADVQQVLRGQ